jgi:hypothetical protein
LGAQIKSNQMFGVIGWVRNTDTSIRRLAGGKIQLGVRCIGLNEYGETKRPRA